MNNADSAVSEFGVRGLGGNPPKLVKAVVESSQMRFEKQYADTVNAQVGKTVTARGTSGVVGW